LVRYGHQLLAGKKKKKDFFCIEGTFTILARDLYCGF
jgi:hypothetical protein